MCKSIFSDLETCNCDDCLPPGSMDEPTSMVKALGHVACAWCGLYSTGHIPGQECDVCRSLKNDNLTFSGRTYIGLTAYVLWNSSGRGRTYTKWYTCEHTVKQWKKQGVEGRVIARYRGGNEGPATWLYLCDNGELWRFWERDGRPLRATLLGTVNGSTFTPDHGLKLRTAEEYQASEAARSAHAISRAVFG